MNCLSILKRPLPLILQLTLTFSILADWSPTKLLQRGLFFLFLSYQRPAITSFRFVQSPHQKPKVQFHSLNILSIDFGPVILVFCLLIRSYQFHLIVASEGNRNGETEQEQKEIACSSMDLQQTLKQKL